MIIRGLIGTHPGFDHHALCPFAGREPAHSHGKGRDRALSGTASGGSHGCAVLDPQWLGGRQTLV
jgi:hypothetical protein